MSTERFVARQHALLRCLRNLHHTRLEERVGLLSLGLSQGRLEARQLSAVRIVDGLDTNLKRHHQVDGSVGRTNGKCDLEGIGARDQAVVEGWKPDLLASGGQCERDINCGSVTDWGRLFARLLLRLAGLPNGAMAIGVVRVGGFISEAGVARIATSVLGDQLLRPGDGIQSLIVDQVDAVGVAQRRGTVVASAAAEVGKMVHSTATKEGGYLELGRYRVDLGGSRVRRVGDKLEVHARGASRSFAAIGGEHHSPGLCSVGRQLTSLGREDALANGLGLGELVALVTEADIDGSLLGCGGENLQNVVGNHELERLLKALDVAKGADLDGVLNFSHVRGHVVVLPTADAGRHPKVLLLHIGIDNVVRTGPDGELVRDNEVEGNSIALTSAEDVVSRQLILLQRHAQLHEGPP